MKQKVAIIMGSDSDLSVMKEAAQVLDQFKVDYDITIISAHRTPERLFSFSKSAHDSYDVIIAGAGGSAHLPGMVASLTHLPVIGVPIKSKALSGIDSLYSIVQMPRGIAVATVAINNAYNAGLLAVQILSLLDKDLKKLLIDFRASQTQTVLEKADKLEKKGYKEYLNE